MSHCENINVPVMGYNCQWRPAPDSCVASLICSPGDLHSSPVLDLVVVSHTNRPPSVVHRRGEGGGEEAKAMLIEDASSSRINHQAHVSFLLKSGPSEEEKNNSVSHDDREEDTAQERCPETRVETEGGGRRRIRDTGRGWGGGRPYRGDERRLEGKTGKR